MCGRGGILGRFSHLYVHHLQSDLHFFTCFLSSPEAFLQSTPVFLKPRRGFLFMTGGKGCDSGSSGFGGIPADEATSIGVLMEMGELVLDVAMLHQG